MRNQPDNQYARVAECRSESTLRRRRRGWLLRGLMVVTAALLSACGWLGAGPGIVLEGSRAAEGGWFCDRDPEGEGWDCTRDGDQRLLRLSARTLPADLSAEPARPALGAAAGPETTAEPGSGPAAMLPEYLRLAFRPQQPVSLQELPRGYYAVQLLSMSSRDGLEGLVGEKGISGLAAARVEKDGQLFYALLLGIYENQALARRAAADAPAQFRHVTPWIRPVGSLQAAVARADALADER